MLSVHDSSIVLDFVLGGLSVVLGMFNSNNSRTKTIALAVAAAYHAIDATAYNSDGTLNQARVTFALSLLEKLFPHSDSFALSEDLDEVLAVIHKHASDNLGLVPVAPVPTPASKTPKAK